MKYHVFLIVLALAVCSVVVTNHGFSAGDAADIKAEIDQTMAEVVEKQRELPTKQYSGTVQEVLADRIVDVNVVSAKIKLAKVKTEQVFAMTGERVELKEKMTKYIHERTKEETIEKKERNNTILKFVDEIVNDPNTYEDPNDPNEIAAYQEFYTTVASALNDDGGY